VPEGERRARALRAVLARHRFDAAFTSPLRRAARTAELAGFPGAERTDLLLEYDYGDYEGLTTAEIQARRPGWDLFRDGCPGGETPAQVVARAERFDRLAESRGERVIAFAHGHILRAVAVAWLGLGGAAASSLDLGTATVSILTGSARGRLLQLWNGMPAEG
jgi:broad specificity phosphatase PhoE